MALIVNLDRAEQIDASEMSSVQELGGTSRYMQILMHLMSSAKISDMSWPLGGRWLGQSIWICQPDDQCPQQRLRLSKEIDGPVFDLVKKTCTCLNSKFVV